MTILVTGFEPVQARYTINPSWEAVKLLPDEIRGATIATVRLPCRYGSAGRTLEEAIQKYQPQVLLSVGHSGRVNGLEVEHMGVNRDHCSLEDNDGVVRQGVPIVPDGPDGYFSDLPVSAMVQAIKAAGIPAYESYSAGQYLCNHVLYLGRHLAKTAYPGLHSGFLHVPLCPQQILQHPSSGQTMEIATMARGLCAAIAAIADWLA